MSVQQKVYIGDSVYVSFDGYQICLTTENGFGPSNTIYMEPGVFEGLLRVAQGYFNVEITVKKRGSDEKEG